MESPIDVDSSDVAVAANNQTALYKSPELRRLDGSLTKRYEAFLSNTSDTIWQVFYQGQQPKEVQRNRICGGDLIRLIHSELEGELSADICYKLNEPEVFIRKY